ncbi:hypothetical protein C7441_11372 [Pseudaminobacter salicylatoxidans]|uniref:Inner membrane protein n=1 Tax=Pseudaminobacter salicylatoxidans TaxID=93369 RepID=A0A316BZ62_PSESE|nr:mitofilin family membrane protein [Pseudaminobacter salicylatoxidans]PWJ80145.1 hypothetical protein C7441_11372 [Pseudaminobacter salicylatoxidans]
MVKTPSARHSRTHREPVTIELEPGAVSRISDPEKKQSEPTEAKASSQSSKPQEPAMAEKTVETPAASAKPEEKPKAASEQPKTGTSDAGKKPESASAPSSEARKPQSAATASDRQPPQKPASPAAAPQPRRSGFPPLAAGIVGGVIALAGAGALQYSGVLPAPGSNGGVAQSQIDSLRAEFSGMQQDITALKNAGSQPDTQLAGQVETVTKSLDAVKADLANLRESAAPATGDEAGLQALDGRVRETEAAIAALREQQGASQAASGDLAALGERIAGVEALARSGGEAMTAADGKISALEQKVNDLSGKVEAQAGQPKVALAIASSALKSAVERGAPFEAELETFAAIAPDASGIAQLRTYAQSGVPTLADIQAETKPAIQAMIAAAKPVDEKAGVLDRLVTSAQSLVAVRPVGPVEGAGVPETTARIEYAIKSGELDKALAEFETLPEAAKTAGAGLADKIRARVEAQKLVDQAVAGAMKG